MSKNVSQLASAVACFSVIFFQTLLTHKPPLPAGTEDILVHGREKLKRAKLDFQSRLVMNRAIVNGWETVPILVLARPGKNEAAAKAMIGLGGDVHFRADEIDYIRGLIPRAKVSEFLECDEVQDVKLGFFSLGSMDIFDDKDTVVSSPPSPASKAIAPSKDEDELPVLSAKELPAENPYVPTRDMGAPQFIRQHPTFDGRGVTIAITEQGDFDHPTLRTARALDGKVIPKIAGIIETYDPDHDEMREAGFPFQHNAGMQDRRALVKMQKVIDVKERTFEQDAQEYIAPGPGTYRFGKYVFLPWDPKRKKEFEVLWDSMRQLVWVDTNGNRNFADEKAIGDFNHTHDLSHFPSWNSLLVHSASAAAFPQDDNLGPHDSPLNYPTAFVVTMDEERHNVYIYASTDDHSTMVAGVAAGKHFLGGEANGTAPEAQIIYTGTEGNRTDRLLEGVLAAAKDSRVDVISSSFGSDAIPEDGESLEAMALDRIVARFKKPIVAAQGNFGWPGTEQGANTATAHLVLAAGGYNRGSTRNAIYTTGAHFPPHADYVDWVSSSGPTSIGDMKPDILTPSVEVAARPCSWENSKASMTLAAFRLPPCYSVGGGTSSAAPFAAGAIALLISAAKQSHIPYDAESLYWVLRMSARRLPDYSTNRQGSGLVAIEEAWKLLQQYSRRPAMALRFAAPVRAPLSRYLKTPSEGMGLYENGGWSVGQDGARTVRVLRVGGDEASLHCKIRIIGNDGTFSVPDMTDLPKGVVVDIPIGIRVLATGIHDAILRLEDLQSGLPLGQTSLTVVVGEALSSANRYTYAMHGRIRPHESQFAHVEVPPGTSALKVQLSVTAGNVHFSGDAPSYLGGWVPLRDHLPVGKWTYLDPDPEVGVWQFRIDNWDLFHQDSVNFQEDAEFTVQIESQAARLSFSRSGEGAHCAVRTERVLAPLPNLALVSRPAFQQEIVLPATASNPRVVEAMIPENTESLLFRLESRLETGPGTTDLYVYKCVGTERNHPCRLRDIRALKNRSAQVLVRWPTAGVWKALVDGLSDEAPKQLLLSEVVVGPSPGKILSVSEQGAPGQAARDVRNRPVNEWGRVEFVEAIDQLSEHEESVSPLQDLVKYPRIYPRTDLRPVPVGLAIVRDPTCWFTNLVPQAKK